MDRSLYCNTFFSSLVFYQYKVTCRLFLFRVFRSNLYVGRMFAEESDFFSFIKLVLFMLISLWCVIVLVIYDKFI